MYSKMPTKRNISIFFGFGLPSIKLIVFLSFDIYIARHRNVHGLDFNILTDAASVYIMLPNSVRDVTTSHLL